MEWLNYHHLLYFWTVAREGTVARASKQLGLAQPTISGQLRTLENPNLAQYTNIQHYIDGISRLAAGVNSLIPMVSSDNADKLLFIFQTMSRTAGNLGYIYQNGIYSKFNPNVDNSCKDPDPCQQ